MKQVLQSFRSGELWLAEVPAPDCGPGRVLVRTSRSVVSAGTEAMLRDLARRNLAGKALQRPDLVRRVLRTLRTEGMRATADKVRARLDEPISLGYSAAGRIEETGAGVVGLQTGERVALAGAGYAAHAEFNAPPVRLCAKVPDDVSDDDAAFATLAAIALQGVRQAQPLIGERVAVIGLGLIGLLTVQLLKANGCAVLGVDPDGERAARARALGADAAVNTDGAAACDALTAGRGADAVIIAAAAAGNGPLELAAELARRKARVVVVGLVGLQVPRDPFYRKELDLRLSMSYGPGRYDPDYEERGLDYPYEYVRFTEQRNLESALYLMAQGRLTPAALVTHRVPFAAALDAYALLEGGRPAGGEAPAARPLGIVLEYPPDAPAERTIVRAGAAAAANASGEAPGIGVIGAGRFAAGVLLPRLGAAGVRLTGVCTRSGAGAQRAAERFGFGFATTDAAAVIGDERTDAVIIATRHASHAALAAAALRAGKHVFVEKPLALDEAELDAIGEALEAARAAGREPCLAVGFNRRFSPHGEALRAAFADRRGALAISFRVNAGPLPQGSWLRDPQEGGRLVGEACHFVDFCSAVIGREPLAVSAAALPAPADDAAPESFAMTVRYADGSLAAMQYFADGHAGLPKERCELFADGRTAVCDDFRTTTFHGGGRTVRGRQAKGFSETLQAFLRVCRDGGDWPIPWTSLVATHRVCFAARRSLERGGEATAIAAAAEAGTVGG